jgi:hypothetical protein
MVQDDFQEAKVACQACVSASIKARKNKNPNPCGLRSKFTFRGGSPLEFR